MTATIGLAVAIGCLYAVGVYLLLQRTLTRVVLGIALLSHAGNLLLLTAGGLPGSAPFVGGGSSPGAGADPLPQALALTAIVIGFGVTAFLLALAYRSWVQTRADEVQDDVEDRRIARAAARKDRAAVAGDRDTDDLASTDRDAGLASDGWPAGDTIADPTSDRPSGAGQ